MAGLGPHIPLLAACIVVLAACSTTTKVPADGTLRVALTEYHVQPQSVQEIFLLVRRQLGDLRFDRG